MIQLDRLKVKRRVSSYEPVVNGNTYGTVSESPVVERIAVPMVTVYVVFGLSALDGLK